MTKYEKMLWEKLRNKQLSGYKFRRQHAIAQFVADSCLPAGRRRTEGELKANLKILFCNFTIKTLTMQKATKENNYLYNINLRERARILRRKGTKAGK